MSEARKKEENCPTYNNSIIESQAILERLRNSSLQRQDKRLKSYTDEQLWPVANFIAFTEKIQKKMKFLDDEFTKRTGITLQQRRLKIFPTEKEEREFETFIIKMSKLVLKMKTTPFLKEDLQTAYDEIVKNHEIITPKTHRYLKGSLRNIFLTDSIENLNFPAGCLNRLCFGESTIKLLQGLLCSFGDCGLVILPSDTFLGVLLKMEEILGGLLIPISIILESKGGISREDLLKEFHNRKTILDSHLRNTGGRRKSSIKRDFIITQDRVNVLYHPTNSNPETNRTATKKKREIFFFRRMLRNTLKILPKIEKNILVDLRNNFIQEMQHKDFGHIARDFQIICDLFYEQKKINLAGAKNTSSHWEENDQNFKPSSLEKEVQTVKKENLFLKISNEDLFQEKKLKDEIILDVNEKLERLYLPVPQEKKEITLFLKLENKALLQESQEKIAQRLRSEEKYDQLLEKLRLMPSSRLSQKNLKKLQELVKENSPNEKISLLNLRNKTLEFYLNLIKNENLSLEAENTKLQYFNEEDKLIIPESYEKSKAYDEKESFFIEPLPKKEDLFPMEEEISKNPITPEDAMNEPWFRDLIKKYNDLNEKTAQVNKITLDVIQQKRSLEEEVREFKLKEKENKKVIEDLKEEFLQTKTSLFKKAFDVVKEKCSLEDKIEAYERREQENAKIIEDLKAELFRAKNSQIHKAL